MFRVETCAMFFYDRNTTCLVVYRRPNQKELGFIPHGDRLDQPEASVCRRSNTKLARQEAGFGQSVQAQITRIP